MPVDLHLHSTASDGTLTPFELVNFAARLGFKAIALTDHDSVEGIALALQEAKKHKIEVIPAVELSSDLNGRDIHILGYYINYEQDFFLEHLKRLRQHRYERAIKMLEKLKELGLEIALKEVLAEARNGALGRAHLARVMLKKGYIDSVEEAFKRFLGRTAPCYVEKYIYTPEDAIKLILKVGGIAVLAHPGLSNVDEFIDQFKESGLSGIEVYHSEHTSSQVKKYANLAKKNKLIITGGSDCHGFESTRGLLIGSVSVPDSAVEDLKDLKFKREFPNALFKD